MTGAYVADDVVYGRPAPDAFDLPRALAERERRAEAERAARAVDVELPPVPTHPQAMPQRFEPSGTTSG